jgi:quercetin dioxygenase-like cupin family protein
MREKAFDDRAKARESCTLLVNFSVRPSPKRKRKIKMSTRRRIPACSVITLLSVVAALAVAGNKSDVTLAAGGSPQAMSTRLEDVKWEAMLPELGSDSPQISILRVDPKTNATQLLVRTPKKLHVPFHWHTANETHTMILGTAVFEHDGKREELGPGGFNYIPAKMQHQAWTSEGSVVFITVDGAWDVNWVGNPPGKSDVGQAPPANPK